MKVKSKCYDLSRLDSISVCVMTPARHNNDLRGHTITPDYPNNELRTSATAYLTFADTSMNFSPKTAQSREKAFGFKHDPCPELSSTFYDQLRPKICERIKVLTLTDGNLIHTGQRVNPLSHCAFIASLQAELRINVAASLAPCLNAGYVHTLKGAESDYRRCSWVRRTSRGQYHSRTGKGCGGEYVHIQSRFLADGLSGLRLKSSHIILNLPRIAVC